MLRINWRCLSIVGFSACLVLLSGCGGSSPSFVAKYEPWRGEEENACMQSGTVRATPFIQNHAALGGPSVCGTARPFKMMAALGGRVELKPAALLRCPMIPQVERWIGQVVAPAAYYHFNTHLAEIIVAGSYSCRPINHKSGGKLSEHGYANAIDVSGFRLINGQKITLKRGWNGTPRERAFLRDVRQGSCKYFTTVLSPIYNRAHHDHFHLDLARRGKYGLRRVCK